MAVAVVHVSEISTDAIEGGRMILQYTLAWIPMVFIAIINAVIREMGYKKYVGDLHAHQISTLTGIIFFGLYIWGLSFIWKLESAKQAWTVGFIWLAMTIVFEFIFGHFVMGHPWSKLLYDYNIFAGRIWILVLIWTTVAPYLIYKIRS